MIAFQPQGTILSFTAATSAPAAVQANSNTDVGAQQYMLTNTDASVDCIVGWGDSSAMAILAAAAGTNGKHCYYLLRGTQVCITAGRNPYFTGVTGSGTAIVKVQAGIGN